jgi:hypothetical protein
MQLDLAEPEVLSQIGIFNPEEFSLLNKAYENARVYGILPHELMPVDTINKVTNVFTDTLIDVYNNEFPGMPHLYPIK